jgi:hypothetical protein
MLDARGASRGARSVGDRRDERGSWLDDKVRALAAPEACSSSSSHSRIALISTSAHPSSMGSNIIFHPCERIQKVRGKEVEAEQLLPRSLVSFFKY